MHLTIAETRRLKQVLTRLRRQEPNRRPIINPELHDALNTSRSQTAEIEIDPYEPLVMVGYNRNKIALNIVRDERVEAERAKTLELLHEHYPVLPAFNEPFLPHVTIGIIQDVNAFKYRDLRHPERLLGNLDPPERLALDGLRVYLEGQPLMRHAPVEAQVISA